MSVFLHSPLKLRFKTWQNFLQHILKDALEAAEFRKSCRKQRELLDCDPRGIVVAMKSLDASHTLQQVKEDFPLPGIFVAATVAVMNEGATN